MTSEGARLFLDGKAYRAIGVNMPHLSQGYAGTWFHWQQVYGTQKKMRRAIEDAVRDARVHQVPFIRFSAAPGYPKNTAELYGRDPDLYWRRMEELFRLCRECGVRLVPSLGVLNEWNLVHGEPRTAILDPSSRTYQATYRYVREFVLLVKDDPALLMWELGNEYFLTADVNMNGQAAPPPGVYPEGATTFRKRYTLEDNLTFDMLVGFYKEMTACLKSLDPGHLVTSGDAGPRDESVSRRQGLPEYRVDTLDEHLANLLESQPAPVDVVSIHACGSFTGCHQVGGLSHMEFLRARIRAIHTAGRPIFVGELGQMDPHHQADPETKWTRAAIDVIEEEGVALAAIWVWHFPWQCESFDIPNGAACPLLMRRIAEFNAKYAGRARLK